MRETPTVARAAQIYQFLAYQTFNIALLLLAINLLLAVLFFVYDYTKSGADTRVVSYRERFADYQAYTRITKPEIDTYLDEQDAFGSVGFVYAPWVQFRAPEFRGKYLNTDARGFRRTTAPKSSGGNPLKIHVYGGSTTFGYGVPDDHTIPSYLQRQLDQESGGRAVLVKNFGIGFYYSSQEQQLLLTALKDGDVPDWAIFIDGGNDTAQLSLRHDEPIFTPAMKRAWAGLSVGRQGARLEWIPMVRLANGLAHRLGLAPQSSPAGGLQHQTIKSDAHLSQDEKDAIAAYLTKRYTQNMRITRAVCREYGIKCLFVWQPHPSYKYDKKLHKTFPFEGEIPAHYGRVFTHMERLVAPDFLFLGHLTEGMTKKVYVDDVHYNEAMNEEIAIKISQAILAR